MLAKDMGVYIMSIEDGMVSYGKSKVIVQIEGTIPDFTFGDESCIKFKPKEVDEEGTTMEYLEAPTTASFVTT